MSEHVDNTGTLKESDSTPITESGPAKLPQYGPTAQPEDFDQMFPNGLHPMLRYCRPYWWPYRTFVKQRWIGRQLLEVVASEFRDRSVDYYRHALECGVTRVNGAVAWPEYVLRDGDRLDNTVHRHEPPVTNDPVLVLHVDKEKEFCVISKPGSMPVHASGRYFKHTMLEILKEDHGINGYAVNRLDRLTSGLMILGLSGPASRDLALEFQKGKVQKEYIARVRGHFPDGEVVVDQPLLTVDRQSGLVIVAPQGRDAKTIFTRMSYDSARDQSVVHCRPMTGRTHQIRVHLQYLGYPIPNDPIYADVEAWGPECGKGGVDLASQDGDNTMLNAIADRVRLGTAAATQGGVRSLPDDAARLAGKEAAPEVASSGTMPAREFDNVDLTSPIILSTQARNVIATLRRRKDEAEDWGKWKEVVFATTNAKAAQDAAGGVDDDADINQRQKNPKHRKIPHPRINSRMKRSKAVEREITEENPAVLTPPENLPPGFCNQCFVPMADDPKPSTLFIYLHALRYTTEALGTWETPLPRWAGENWDGDWRGWDGEPPVSYVPEEVKSEVGFEVVEAEEEKMAATG